MSAFTDPEFDAQQEPRSIALRHRHHRHGWWWKALLIGLALWVATIIVTLVTRNANLVPTLILLGSFLVPFCVVLFVVERVQGNVTAIQLVLAFFVGGIAGVLGASLLEAELQRSLWTYGLVGLIEEFVKGCILLIIGWRVAPKTAWQGALLGATVGAGFAAFESAGYAFNAALSSQGIDIGSLLQTEIVRALLTPVGHILWTAIIGAVLFGAAQRKADAQADHGYAWSWSILGAYLGAAFLHALWDSMSSIASLLALILTGSAGQLLEYGFLLRRAAQAVQSLSLLLYLCGMVLVSAAGVVTLWIVLHRARRDATPSTAP